MFVVMFKEIMKRGILEGTVYVMVVFAAQLSFGSTCQLPILSLLFVSRYILMLLYDLLVICISKEAEYLEMGRWPVNPHFWFGFWR